MYQVISRRIRRAFNTREFASARHHFDRKFYRNIHVDVASAGVDEFEHYINFGWREGRDPSPYFPTLLYKDRFMQNHKADTNPYLHFVSLNAREQSIIAQRLQRENKEIQREVIKPYFDTSLYIYRYNIEENIDPIDHYLEIGWKLDYEPNEIFNTREYLSRNFHVESSGYTPFYHVVSTGLMRNASTTAEAERLDRIRSEITEGRSLGFVLKTLLPHFDKEYYLRAYGDVRSSGSDPLLHYVQYGWKEKRNPNGAFWTEFYLNNYNDHLKEFENPFFHYLTVGKSAGFKPNPYNKGLWPSLTAPDEDAWANAIRANNIEKSEVVVIVPVYKGYNETLSAIHAVLCNPQQVPFALLVVNDRSPDQSLTQKLRALAELSYFAYLENEVNLGFVGSVNRALTHSEGKDVILLNSDAIPFGDWIDRLMWHAHADADVATITPMSNNATICSYPVNNDNNRIELEISAKTLDDYSKICNSRLSSPIPTGVGFCFYMRRSVIDCVGLLDAETFGRGYGEENDFCLRASQAGFRNILAHDVFVYHAGGVSFDNIYSENMAEIEKNLLLKHPVFLSLVHQHLLADPGREARARLDLYRAAQHLGKYKAIFVTHHRGGGIQTHTDDLVERLEAEGVSVIILKIISDDALCVEYPRLSRFFLPLYSVEKLYISKNSKLIGEFIDWISPTFIHIHSFVGLEFRSLQTFMGILDRGYKLFYTLHDYSPVCHRNDLIMPDGNYCRLMSVDVCRKCSMIDHHYVDAVDPEVRRNLYSEFLDKVDVIFAPSSDIADRMREHLPADKLVIRPHEERLSIKCTDKGKVHQFQNGISDNGPKLKIAVIGAIGPHKGSYVLHDLALDAKLRQLPIEYMIIGYSHMTDRMGSVGVHETGRYNSPMEAVSLLQINNIDLVFVPSIWPETYCYTLSIALASGIPPVVFDLGAPAERLRNIEQGIILDYALKDDVKSVNDLLLRLDLGSLRQNVKPYSEYIYADFVREYYGMHLGTAS